MKKIISLILTLILLTTTFSFPQSANANEVKNKSGNPVIEGYYSDPDIDYFDHKYWIFPTTDGIINETGWWGGKTFTAFSSEDMVNWKNEGVILDVKADNEEEAGLNENGIQIAYSKWSCAHAWAPSIEKIGDKYFFFYVASVKEEYMSKYCTWLEEEKRYLDDKAIGVAVADSPTGPYVAYDEPLLYSTQVKTYIDAFKENTGIDYAIPSVIDPSVFVDDIDSNKDGQNDIYITFGNWTPMIVRVNVNDDLITIDDSVFKPINGIPWGHWPKYPNGFMESIVIFKRNKQYYFTWSVNGTANINYRVAYGTANKITNKVEYKGTLLELDKDKQIYGTAHQSILHNPIDNKYYICYHRLQNNPDNPLVINPDNGDVGERGNFRETCIDEISFDFAGNASAKPTHEGVTPVSVHDFELISTTNPTCTTKGYTKYTCKYCSKTYSTPINATGHKAVTDKAVAATCTKAGKTAGSHCSVCKTVIKKQSVVKAKGHSYDKGKVTTKPTDKKTGVLTYTCKTCKAKKTEKLAKLTNVSGVKVSGAKKALNVSWKKNTKMTGYEIQYSTNKNFKKAKTVKVTKNSTTKTAIKKLSSKKYYYVRVRTYKTINGTSCPASWSKAIKVKTK